jgi:hypothetical protein
MQILMTFGDLNEGIEEFLVHEIAYLELILSIHVKAVMAKWHLKLSKGIRPRIILMEMRQAKPLLFLQQLSRKRNSAKYLSRKIKILKCG